MTLRELLVEWHQHQPDLTYLYSGGSVDVAYDGYYAEFEEGEIGGECGYSRAQAMVFAGVCSAIEREVWDGRYNFGEIGIRRRLEYVFRAKETDRDPVYAALIIWANAPSPYGETQVSFTAQGSERGSTMLEAWLKYLDYSRARASGR